MTNVCDLSDVSMPNEVITSIGNVINLQKSVVWSWLCWVKSELFKIAFGPLQPAVYSAHVIKKKLSKFCLF